MAIAIACHVGPVTGSGAASVATSCQRVVGSCSTCHGERSRIIAVDTACQRVVGPPQGEVEPHGIRYRKWNRIMAVIVIYQGMRTC